MAHEIAKLLLEKAGTFLERSQAVQTALSLGMSLREIEEYLDWIENVRLLHISPHEESLGKRPRRATPHPPPETSTGPNRDQL
jgi:hypothetical protein